MSPNSYLRSFDSNLENVQWMLASSQRNLATSYPDRVADLLMLAAVLQKDADLFEAKYGATHQIRKSQVEEAFTTILRQAANHPEKEILFNRIAVKLKDMERDYDHHDGVFERAERKDRNSHSIYRMVDGLAEIGRAVRNVLEKNGVPIQLRMRDLKELRYQKWINLSEFNCDTPEAFEARIDLLKNKEIIGSSPDSFKMAYAAGTEVWRDRREAAEEYDRCPAFRHVMEEGAREERAKMAAIQEVQQRIIEEGRNRFPGEAFPTLSQRITGFFKRSQNVQTPATTQGVEKTAEEKVPQLTH